MAKRDRSDKRGEREWGVDPQWKVFQCSRLNTPEDLLTKSEGGAVF
jgi:hypothetical protein